MGADFVLTLSSVYPALCISTASLRQQRIHPAYSVNRNTFYDHRNSHHRQSYHDVTVILPRLIQIESHHISTHLPKQSGGLPISLKQIQSPIVNTNTTPPKCQTNPLPTPAKPTPPSNPRSVRVPQINQQHASRCPLLPKNHRPPTHSRTLQILAPLPRRRRMGKLRRHVPPYSLHHHILDPRPTIALYRSIEKRVRAASAPWPFSVYPALREWAGSRGGGVAGGQHDESDDYLSNLDGRGGGG